MTAPEVASEFVVAESHAIEPSAASATMRLKTYREIQRAFDREMPDAIMEIQGKKFRKKSYWRAIGTEYLLNLEVVSEGFTELADGDWKYDFVCRATSPNGRFADGDGTCTASEKVDRNGNPTKMQTHHNVRSHAKTRATNRALTDLVAFGEVSADELGPDAFGNESERTPNERPRPHFEKPVGQRGAGKLASEKQTKMLYMKSLARAKTIGITGTEYENEQALGGSIRKVAMEMLGFESKEEITAAAVTPLVASIEAAKLDDENRVVIPEGEL
jgi:hypothetical protein